MTRICEEFIEEITSGSGTVSDALTQHLASCSTCREASASFRQLKDARKPLSGKEAAAIAGILKAVKTGAVSTGASSQAAVGGSLLFKSLGVAICVLSVIGVLLMQIKSPDRRGDEPTNGITTVIKKPSEAAAITSVDESEDLTDNVAVASASAGDTQTAESVASDTFVDNPKEDNKNGEAQTISVSPDEEDIQLR